MTNDQILSMTKYYESKHGIPTDSSDAIYKLTNAYKELFNEVPTSNVKEGIAEYYRILTSKDLPAYLWILESFHVTSKKEKEKRNFSYCVGMIRTWLKYGFGHIPNQEEDELADYFKEVTGYDMSYKGRRILQTLMGTYGIIKVTIMMNELKTDVDISEVLMLLLKNKMDEKYSIKAEDSK